MKGISVVIPTFGSGLLEQAIRSALDQTLAPTEVIVVVDEPNPATADIVKAIADDRIRTIELPRNVGAASARNAGVASARGDWIAHLDHDDEWLPTKLEKQMDAIRRSSSRFPIASCRLIARTDFGDFVWPRRLPDETEPIGDFLFARRSLFAGEGLLQTSTLLTSRELALRIPFRAERHDDFDWCLRADAVPGARWHVVPEPLSIWRFEDGRRTLSGTSTPQSAAEWVESVRPLLSRRAYSGFLLSIVAALAAERREWRVLGRTLTRACLRGAPTPTQLAVFAGVSLLSRGTRRSLRRRFSPGPRGA